jgi:hypothetical protein
MRLPRLDEGQTRFKPYLAGLREAVQIARNRWLTIIRPQFAAPPLRVLRGNMTQLFIQEARTLIGGISGVRFIDTKSLRTIVVFDPPTQGEVPWVARFKHVDEDFRTRNIRTKATRCFDAQEDLPDIPSGSIYFTFGYQMAGIEAELTGPHVILALNQKIYWRYNIDDPSVAMEAAYLFDGGTPPPPTPRVRPVPGLMPKKKNETPEK